MLKKIESVLIRVNDVAEAADFYAEVFGLKPFWRDEQHDTAGLLFPDGMTEVVLFYDPPRTGQDEVQYLVDDVVSALQHYTEQGCVVITPPFEIHAGKCAVIKDPFGTRFVLRDLSGALVELETL